MHRYTTPVGVLVTTAVSMPAISWSGTGRTLREQHRAKGKKNPSN